MSTRTERDRQKVAQEKYQAILSRLLKEEDNKYCVDCDAKGPRWASHNLGIFLCIRCAGIHRNLGVHISKVKSVNLDTWIEDQVAMMQEMGNSRARAVYEANIPDHFRRPQTDSSLEAFIRAKYERKKYIAKEWVPPTPNSLHLKEPVEEKKEKKPKNKPANNVPLQATERRHKNATASAENNEKAQKKPEKVPAKSGNIDDILGLDAPVSTNTTAGNGGDLFSDFMSAPNNTSTSAANNTTSTATSQNNAASNPTSSTTNSANDDMSSLFNNDSSSSTNAEPVKNTKESILALYGNTSQQTPMYGVPGGMYMPQQGGLGINMGIMSNGGMMNPQVQGAMPGAQMGNMPMMNGQQMMPGQQPTPGQQQMPGQQPMPGMMPQQGVQGGMMHQMPQAYGQQQQVNQQQYMYNMQQMQNQMSGMNLSGGYGGGMEGYNGAAPQIAGQGGMNQAAPQQTHNWGAAPGTGQTLSTNLWQ